MLPSRMSRAHQPRRPVSLAAPPRNFLVRRLPRLVPGIGDCFRVQMRILHPVCVFGMFDRSVVPTLIELSPFLATLPGNRLLTPIIATLPKTPFRKSLACHTSNTPQRSSVQRIFPSLPLPPLFSLPPYLPRLSSRRASQEAS